LIAGWLWFAERTTGWRGLKPSTSCPAEAALLSMSPRDWRSYVSRATKSATAAARAAISLVRSRWVPQIAQRLQSGSITGASYTSLYRAVRLKQALKYKEMHRIMRAGGFHEFRRAIRSDRRWHVEHCHVFGDQEGTQWCDRHSRGCGRRPARFQVATSYSSTFSAAEELVPPAGCESRSQSAWLYRGLQYYRGLVVATYYTHTLVPNARLRDCIMSTAVEGHAAARSYHPNAVNVAMADASVRVATSNVDINVWRAVGTINNGETITDF